MTRNYRKFYLLLKQLPGAEKEALVRQFTEGRTESLGAMHTHEYQLMLAMMEGKVRTVNTPCAEFDVWRKRVMASVGGWLTACGTQHTADTIKSIAARAAQRTAFNDITLSELRALYYEFLNKQKVAKQTKNLQA
jgi:hypothetical protein